MADEEPEVLISAEALAERVEGLAVDISEHYAGAEQPVVLACVLKGATVFLADLVRSMPIDVACDFMSISSYGTQGSGVVRILKDLETDIGGRDVLIVEDIVDTGLTLNYLRRTLSERGPRSLAAVTLLDKAVRRIVPVELEWSGFEIPDVYVLGYGIDHQGIYRNLDHLLVAGDIARLAVEPYMYVPRLWPEAGTA